MRLASPLVNQKIGKSPATFVGKLSSLRASREVMLVKEDVSHAPQEGAASLVGRPRTVETGGASLAG